MSDPSSPQDGAQARGGATPARRRTATRRGRVVRRPRMVPFLVSGGLIGAFVGVMLTLLGPPSRNATSGQELILLAGSGVLLGGLVGAIVYLLVERLSPR